MFPSSACVGGVAVAEERGPVPLPLQVEVDAHELSVREALKRRV